MTTSLPFGAGTLPDFQALDTASLAPSIERLLGQARTSLAALEREGRIPYERLMGELEKLSDPLERSWDAVLHLLSVRNSEELRSAQEALQGPIVQFHIQMAQSEALYRTFQALCDGPEWDQIPPAGQRIVEGWLRDAKLAGVALQGEAKERFAAIQTELAELATRFSNQLLDATKSFELVLRERSQLEGLPDSFLAAAASSARLAGHAQATPDQGPWRVTLDLPSLGPFLRHSQQRELREQVYRAYVTRASSGEHDNLPVIQRTLVLRQEMAELLGYSSYVEVSLASKMAPDAASVRALSEKLRAVARPAAQKEHAELQAYAAAQGFEGELRPWDIAFWSERLREELFALSDEELRPYFPLNRVLEGLFAWTERLFGVRIEATDGDLSIWHPDVRTFRVIDAEGQLLANFFLDPYARPEDKRGGAWCSEAVVRSRRLAKPGEAVRLPGVYLVCNQSPPVDDRPSLMTLNEVETLFHEFGHGLHQMLTTVDEAFVAGFRGVEWDAVELPSQFMENWIYRPEVMRDISSHYQTGEPLPEEWLERVRAARTYRAGSDLLRQLLFSSFDLDLHDGDGSRFEGPDGLEELQAAKARTAERNSIVPLLPEDRLECGFAHIFAGGYAAGYYGYKWAEVLSADAFAAFEETNFEPQAMAEVGRRFRAEVLAVGGSRHPMDVFRSFRGREPETEALLRHSGLW